MDNLDDRIRKGINRDGVLPSDDDGREEKLYQLVMDSFRRGRRWLFIAALAKTVFFFAVAVVAGFQFFKSTQLMELIGWSTLVLISAIGMSMMAIALYMDLNRNALTRELKRLEIRLIQSRALHSEVK